MSVATSQVKDVTREKIAKLLYAGYEPYQKATLAKLRQGIGRMPGDIPDLWGIVFDGLPAEMYSTSRHPSDAEWAIYTALTMFALHQQGREPKTQPMHVSGVSLGTAISRLVREEGDKTRVSRRFNALATSADIKECTTHLRSLIQQLRSESIPLDYAALAGDLYLFQHPSYAPGVKLRWGQDFHRIKKTEKENIGKVDSTNEE